MRRGRAIVCLICVSCALGVLAVAGCGKESHPNDPRPPIPTPVTVSVTPASVVAEPARVGVADSTDNMSQNEGQTEPKISSKVPLLVSFTIANLTDTPTKMEIVGPAGYTSNVLLANGTASFSRSLPTGLYRIRAVRLPQATPATLTVGPVRDSSSNDLLLP